MREISLIQIVSTSRVEFWHTLSASKCYKRFQSENYPESEWEKKWLNAKQQNKTVHYSEVSWNLWRGLFLRLWHNLFRQFSTGLELAEKIKRNFADKNRNLAAQKHRCFLFASICILNGTHSCNERDNKNPRKLGPARKYRKRNSYIQV